jgi:putative hydrolase of the HAD superfamily
MSKQITTILIDFDEVLTEGLLFSKIYSKQFGIPIEEIVSFIRDMQDDVTIGKGDLLDKLNDVLTPWKWTGSAEELLDYWLKSDTQLNEELVDRLKTLQKQGSSVYLATNQEMHRGKYIWEELGLNKWMNGKFISCEMGVHKSNPEFFDLVLSKLALDPSEIIFFDDKELFVNNARSKGIKGVVYKSINDFIENIN